MALHLLCQVSPREICGGQGDTETCFSQSSLISPVSIIRPILHIH